MKIECCNKIILEYEIKQRIRELKKKEELNIKITPCEIFKGTYDLEIKEVEKI